LFFLVLAFAALPVSARVFTLRAGGSALDDASGLGAKPFTRAASS